MRRWGSGRRLTGSAAAGDDNDKSANSTYYYDIQLLTHRTITDPRTQSASTPFYDKGYRRKAILAWGALPGPAPGQHQEDDTTRTRHRCPAVDAAAASALADVLRRNDWITRALRAVADSGVPDAWIGAGVIRDVVWGDRFGCFDRADVRDVDVPFFDPADLSRERDLAAQRTLTGLADLPWEATNQAAVHTWYHDYFGGPPAEAFGSVHDAVATWPETATCVAVRMVSTGTDIEVCAPHGLGDLLGGVWRVNPVRVTPEISAARLSRQRVHPWWPRVTIVPPG